MRGLVASVTSCIGGKDERYAIKVQPQGQEPYFVYKNLAAFEHLWGQLVVLAEDIKRKQSQPDNDVGLLGKWLASFVDHFAFPTVARDLRTQGQEILSTLNVVLHALLRRVSALYVENTILRCGVCAIGRQLALLLRNFLEFARFPSSVRPSSSSSSVAVGGVTTSPRHRKRQLSEMRPEDVDATKRTFPMPLFPGPPAGGSFPRSPKTRKLSATSSEEFMVPVLQKVELNRPVVTAMPPRRRVFAEVEFAI